MHFANQDKPRPCWTCKYDSGLLSGNDINGLCGYPRLLPLVGQPGYGCAFWMREPGADDEPSQP